MSPGNVNAGFALPDRGSRGWYVLLFAATGVVIYWCGTRGGGSGRSGDAAPVSATIVVHATAAEKQAALAGNSLRADLEKTLWAEANLSGLLSPLASSIPAAQWRENLAMAIAPGRTADEFQITITCAAGPAKQSLPLVNALAEQCAELWQARRQQQWEQQNGAAREAAEHARQTLRDARASLAGFLERHFREVEEAARRAHPAEDRAAVPPPAATTAAPAPSATERPRATDNPQWTAVWQELVAQRQALQTMLERRTPEHPEAQKIQARVSELEQRLAELPRQILEERPVPQSVAPVAPPASADPAAPRLVVEQPPNELIEAARTYWLMRAAVEDAAGEEARLAQREREVWQEGRQGTSVEVRLADMPAATVAVRETGQLFWIAVAAATAVAAGSGMIATGARRDPLLCTAEQVSEAVAPPVLGLIREDDLPADAMLSARRGIAGGWWLSGGIALIVCSLISVAMIFGGWTR